jgi:hypothetical protein
MATSKCKGGRKGGYGGGYRKPARPSDPCPIHSNRLIDYASWWRSWHRVTDERGRLSRLCSRPNGNTFRIDHLTALGRQVWDTCLAMMGRAPSHRGANRRGVYLKWTVKDDADPANAAVLRDQLLDIGLDVVLTEPVGTRSVRLLKGRRGDVVVRYVKLTLA